MSNITNNYFNTQNMQLILSYHYNQNKTFTVNRNPFIHLSNISHSLLVMDKLNHKMEQIL